ncbi:6-carboxytetrahydropterin synthase QueD [candidate division KSB1 bacterium]|nr:6-carboxytetrahydropterin synthase QueD [candidate division KSB1 bacterium]
MYQICARIRFAAAHRLDGYQGACSNIHGHTWTVKACVAASACDEIGIAYDFKDLKKLLKDIIDRFDHQLLNECPPFDLMNPTSENIAKTIFQQLKAKLPPKINMSYIEVNESENYGIIYSEDEPC